MNKRFLYLVFFLTILSLHVAGQVNLVNNQSFETYTACPTGLSQTTLATPWTQPTNHQGSSDYFNACATTGGVGVPNNTFGSSAAAQGNAYCGFYTYLVNSVYREYVTGSLSSALVSGQTYVLSLKWARASNTKYASDAFGVYFSNGVPVSAATTSSLSVTPQCQNPSGNFLSSTSWTLFSDTFIAAGGEQYLTIGSFTVNATGSLVSPTAWITGAYMYVDDVQVILYQGIMGDSNICLGNTAQLYWLGENPVYWVESNDPNAVISNDDTIYVNPASPTTYWAIDGIDTSSFTVNVIDLPEDFAGDDTTVCIGDTVTRAIAIPNVNYLWSNNETDSVLVTTSGGTYSVEIESHGCVSTDSFDIAYHDFPSFSLGNDTTICHYDNIPLFTGLTSPLLFTWSTNAAQPQITANDSGTYWVDVTNENCTYRDSIVITYHPPLVVDLGNDSHFCYINGAPIIPTTANATLFQWSTGASASTINVTASNTYTLTVSDGYCEAEDSVKYDFYYEPLVNLGNDTSFCSGDVITLQSNQPSGIEVFWNNGSSLYDFTLNMVGLYWVEVSSAFCSMRDTININQYPVLAVNLGEDIMACENDVITLDPSSTIPPVSYAWSSGHASPTLTVNGSGSFNVTVSDGTCFASDEINVHYFKYPELDLGPDTAVCPATELIFDITAKQDFITYTWFNGDTEPLQVFPARDSATYWASVTNIVCTTSDTVHITLRSLPDIELGNDTAICPNATLELKPKNGSLPKYSWSTGDSLAVLQVQNEGVYELSAFDGYCTATDSIHIDFKPVPEALVLDAPATMCLGEVASLDATDELYTGHRWQDGSTEPVFYADSSGTYSVMAYHDCGVNTDTVFIDHCECMIWMPAAFTPELNEVNDLFKITSECRLLKAELSVYNRWGQRLFHTEDPTIGWDGTYLGKDVPEGAYGWRIFYVTDQSGQISRKEIHGNVVLLR